MRLDYLDCVQLSCSPWIISLENTLFPVPDSNAACLANINKKAKVCKRCWAWLECKNLVF